MQDRSDGDKSPRIRPPSRCTVGSLPEEAPVPYRVSSPARDSGTASGFEARQAILPTSRT